MKESFGQVGSTATQVCVIITNFRCLIMYLVIIGDVLCGNKPGAVHLGVLQEWFGNQWWSSREFSLFSHRRLCHASTGPFTTYPLRFSSFISVLLAVIFVGICSVLAFTAFFEGEIKRAGVTPQMAPQKNEGRSN